MMRRFQANMIAILAIEQLTGAMAAPPVAVSATGEASIFRMLIAEREAIEERIDRIDRQLRPSQGAGPSAEADAVSPAETSALSSEQQSELTDERERLVASSEFYAQALRAIARGESTASDFSVSAVQASRSVQATDAVAQAVEAITVASMLQGESLGDLCFEAIRRRDYPPSDAVQSLCESRITAEFGQRGQTPDMIQDAVRALLAGERRLNRDELDALIALLAQQDAGFSSGDLRDFSRARQTQGPQQ
jgi:hypothetical protein